MKRCQFLLVIFLASLTNSFAQPPNFSWVNGMGTNGTVSQGNAIFADNAGNVYTTGGFEGTVDFNPGAGNFFLSSSSGSEDIFIQKLDVNGNFIWAKSIGGTMQDCGLSIVVNPNGTIQLTGYFSNTVDFDPGVGIFNLTSVSTTNDIFVMKLDAGGNFVWAKQMGGNYADRGQGIAVDDTGNVYTTGHFNSFADFDPGPGTFNLNNSGSYDIFIQKLDSTGNFVWAKKIGGTNLDIAYSIQLDPSGNMYLCGSFENTVDFDPGAGVQNQVGNNHDIFILKLNAAGDFVWVKTMSGPSNEAAHSIALDSDNNIYATGEFYSTVDFDPGAGTLNLSSLGQLDIFVVKLDNSGNLLWAKSEGGIENDWGNSIALDTSDNVCLTGIFASTVDFDPGPAVYNQVVGGSFGTQDIFVQKLDPAGNFGWVFSLGDSSLNHTDNGNSLYIDASNNMYLTGNFLGTVDFDPGPGINNLSVGLSGERIFVLKLNQCNPLPQPSPIIGGTAICSSTGQTYSVTNDPSATSYTWSLPGGWTGTSTTNSINVTTGTSGGAISVMASGACGGSIPQTLNVSIIPNTSSNQTISACTSYLWPVNGNTYFSSGIYNDTILNMGGCDSVITLNLTIHNNTSSSFSVTTCDNYTWPVNGNNYTSSGSYNATIPSANGCDSVITLDLTINNNSSSSQTTTACNNYTWPVNGNNYTSSGIYNATIPNTSGCDSVITLNLTINNSSASTQFTTACNNYTWPVNGNNYTSSGSYNATIPNALGCDSLITLNLTINNNTSSSINASDCESYISPSGNYTWTTTGSHLDTIPNSDGCDSIITVVLTIHGLPPVSYTETTTPACVYWVPFNLTPGTPTGGTYSGSGITGNSFDPLVAGIGNHSIIYQYTDGNNCSNSDTSFIQVNACLYLEEESNDPVILFPNPNYGNFTVTIPGTETGRMRIYDFTGKLVSTEQLSGGDNQINLNARSGMYFVHLFHSTNDEMIIKLVIR